MAPSGGRGRGRGQGRRRGGDGGEGEASPEWLPPQQRRELEASRSARSPPTGDPGQQPRVLRSRIPIFKRRQGQSQEFLQQPDLRAAAGLDEGEARGRIAPMVLRRQQGDVWAPGSPVGQVDIEGVQVDLIGEEDEEQPPGLLPQQADNGGESGDDDGEPRNDAVEARRGEQEDGEVLLVQPANNDAEVEVAQPQPAVDNLQPGPPLPTLQELHSTAIPTHKWPPKQSRADFTREAGALWDKVASNPRDVHQWIRLLIFPRVIIPATSPRSSALSLADQVKDRLRRWRAGEVAQLWQEAVQNLEQPRRGRKRRREDETEEEILRKRNAKRAYTMASEGQFTKALQAITSSGMAEYSAATERQMRSKHPPPQRPIGPPPTTEHAPISFTSTSVLKHGLKFRKGSAPGPSGLRPEHLRVVLQSTSARRDSALVSLTKLLNKMMAGCVPAEVAPYLCGARLHAARKKEEA